MSIHCCRMPYLIKQFGQEVFDLLYIVIPNVNCIQIVFSYIPDIQQYDRYKHLLNEINESEDVLVYSQDYIDGIMRWNWEERWEICDYLSDVYPLPNNVWEKFKTCRLVHTEQDFLQIDNETWTIRELEQRSRMEDLDNFSD